MPQIENAGALTSRVVETQDRRLGCSRRTGEPRSRRTKVRNCDGPAAQKCSIVVTNGFARHRDGSTARICDNDVVLLLRCVELGPSRGPTLP